MMKTVASLVCAVLFAASGVESLIGSGDCPNLRGQATLDVAKYMGVWYEYQRFPTSDQAGLECTSAQYSLACNGAVDVFNKGYFTNGTMDTITGTASVVDASKPSELNVVFPTQPDFTGGRPNYYIIDTDYDNYSLVYSCTQLPGDRNIQFAWVLTRERGVAPTNLTDLEATLTTAGVDVSAFVPVNQDGCP